jgi:hypothetical protein
LEEELLLESEEEPDVEDEAGGVAGVELDAGADDDSPEDLLSWAADLVCPEGERLSVA